MPKSKRPEILRVLREAEEPLTSAQIARAVGCVLSVARQHMWRLRKGGVVVAEKETQPSTGGRPWLLYSLAPEPERKPTPFDGDPFWSDIAAAMARAAEEREERERAKRL